MPALQLDTLNSSNFKVRYGSGSRPKSPLNTHSELYRITSIYIETPRFPSTSARLTRSSGTLQSQEVDAALKAFHGAVDRVSAPDYWNGDACPGGCRAECQFTKRAPITGEMDRAQGRAFSLLPSRGKNSLQVGLK